MYCLTCGRELEEGFLFCDGCGAPVPKMSNMHDTDSKANLPEPYFEPYQTDSYGNDRVNHSVSGELRCQKCGTTLLAGSLFCDACGAPVETIERPVQPRQNMRSPVNIPKTDIDDLQNMLSRMDNHSPVSNPCSGGLIRCPYCGEMIDDDSVFCEMCGKNLG